MHWREEYKRRLSTAVDAMKLVKSGDLAYLPIAGPRVLPGALYRHCVENNTAIDLRVGAPLTDPGWFQAGHEETFRIEFELFIGDFARHAMDEGRATYLPNLFSLNYKDTDEGRPESRIVDVFLVSVTPPDDDGYVSFGAHNWNKRSHTRLHPNVAIASAWSGSDSDDLKIVTNNPKFQVKDPEYVLDLRTIAQNDNFYAMNNALSVDLTGQINSESVFGARMINGTGGQPEFQIGAALSRGGRGITLLPSTALDGAVSRVVAQHEAGAIITVPRYFADTVVTEYGIARLWGKNHRQRARELVAVAHLDFRAELKQAADRL